MDPHFHDPEILLAHDGFVRALSRSLIGDAAVADDLAQEAWVATLESSPRVRSSARAWLSGVVRHLALEWRRREGRLAAREKAAARPELVPSDTEILEREEARRAVVVSVLGLAEPYRSVLLLRYFEDLSPREIALRLEIPFETARTRLKRALELVRAELDRREQGDRRAWCLALLPFARLAPPAPPDLGLIASLRSEIATMSLPLKLSISTVVLGSLAIGAWGWARGAKAPAGAPAAVPPSTTPRERSDRPTPPEPSRLVEAQLPPQSPEGPPKIFFDRIEHEFGQVDEGPELPTEFHFTNKGTGALRISEIRPLCGCTIGAVEVDGRPYTMSDPILPEHSGVVRVTLRTTGFAGEKSTGLMLVTNDLELPKTAEAVAGVAALKVHATIRKPIAFEGDSSILFGTLANSESLEKTLTLKSATGAPFQIVGFDPTDPQIALRAEPVDAAANRWNVSVSMPVGMPLGPISRQFRVLTKPETPSPTSFLITGVVRGAIDLEPAQGLHFSVIAHGRPAMKYFTLRNRNPKTPLKLENVRLLDPTDRRSTAAGAPEKRLDARLADHIEITPRVLEPGLGIQLDVVIKETMPAGSFSAQLVFSTGVPGGPEEIRTMITGYVR